MNKRAKQKIGVRNFKPSQLWNLNDYLAMHIHSALLQFKHMERNAYPGNGKADTPEKWEEILNKMIWSFNQVAKDYPSDPHYIAWEKYHKEHPEEFSRPLFEKDEDGHLKFPKDGFKFTDELDAERKEYNYKVQEGLDLFAEFLPALWD